MMYNDPLNYNKDINDLKSSRSGSYSNYLTSINKLPDPWMSQTPSSNNNVLLNSSVLPPPFSYIDIDKKMKREMIMRQVQEKEEQNAKNINNNAINNPVNFGNNVNIGSDSNTLNPSNDNKMDNFMMNSVLNTYNINTENNDINDINKNVELSLNPQKPNSNQQFTYGQTIVNQEHNENINNNDATNNILNNDINNKINLNIPSNPTNNILEEKIDSSNGLYNNKSLKKQDSLSLSIKSTSSSDNLNKYNKSKENTISNISISSNRQSSPKGILSSPMSINNSKHTLINNDDKVLNITQDNNINNNKNNVNFLVKDNEIDIASVHSKRAEDMGKSISVCTLDIDSSELEIDLNQTSIKIDDSKFDNTTHDPFEAQYKLLAQGGEDHIKELENRVLQGFESDDEIISIMSSERKNNNKKEDSSSKILNNSISNHSNNEEEDKDEDTERERPRNKWLKSRDDKDESKNEINEINQTVNGIDDNTNIQNSIKQIMENNSLKEDNSSYKSKSINDFNSTMNLNQEININNLKDFGSDNINENENSRKSFKERSYNESFSKNGSNKSPFKSSDIVFNWEDEYDKSKIENTLKEMNEKVIKNNNK